MDVEKARHYAQHADTIRHVLLSPTFYFPRSGTELALYLASLEMLSVLFEYHVGTGDTIAVRSVALDSLRLMDLIPVPEVSVSLKYK